MPSDARLPKSKDRPKPLLVGIWRPFRSTRLKSGPNPRTVTRAPSPRSLSMETPVMRCSDSARLLSGKSPMSSAVMASTMPSRARFKSIDCFKLCRMPTTITSSTMVGSAAADWASWPVAVPLAKASETAAAIGVFLKLSCDIAALRRTRTLLSFPASWQGDDNAVRRAL